MLLSSHCIQSLVFHTLLKDLFQLCQICLLFNALKLRKNDLLKTEQENTKKTERIYSDNMKESYDKQQLTHDFITDPT